MTRDGCILFLGVKMPIEYEPNPADETFVPKTEDDEYAEVFASLVEVVGLSGNAERLVLRLSTCRNGFLTVNALFMDLSMVLGHGRLPSPLSRAIEHLRRGENRKAHKLLGEVGHALREYEDKRDNWNHRQELEAELEDCLANDRFRPAESERLRKVLRNDRTQGGGASHRARWEPKFYQLSVDQPAPVTEWLALLDKAKQTVEGIAAVCRCLSNTPTGDSLFENEMESAWKELFDCAKKHATALGLTATPDNGTVIWADGNGGQARLVASCPGASTANPALRHLVTHMSSLERQVYGDLTRGFRPNEASRPMPPPFKIDLTYHEPSVPASDGWHPVALPIDLGCETPRSIRVGMLDCGVPLTCYNGRSKRYEDGRREEVARLAREAILSCCSHGGDVLVLPEYFLPRTHKDELAALASERNVALISGVEAEASPTDNPLLVNESIIQLPNARIESQLKQRASKFESPLYQTGDLKVFRGTNIGTFAVLVCSDFSEVDIVMAVASAASIDILFICSFNPRPDLFQTMAMADAWRLYCHVVVANNYAGDGKTRSEDAASASGSLVCSPTNQLEQMVKTDGERKELALPVIGGCTPAIRLYDLSLESVAKHNEEAAGGYLRVPRCRHSQQR